MGVWMPEMDDREATRAIKEELPKTSILMLTAHDREDYLLEAMRAGAASYVPKRFTPQQLLSAVRGVLRGEFPLDQKLGMVLLSTWQLRRLTSGGRGSQLVPVSKPPSRSGPKNLSPLVRPRSCGC